MKKVVIINGKKVVLKIRAPQVKPTKIEQSKKDYLRKKYKMEDSE